MEEEKEPAVQEFDVDSHAETHSIEETGEPADADLMRSAVRLRSRPAL